MTNLIDKAGDHVWNKLPENIRTLVAVLILAGFVFFGFYQLNKSNKVSNTTTKESIMVSNSGTNSGTIVGKIEVLQNGDKKRQLDIKSQELLLEKINRYEHERNKGFEYIVVSASPDGESQGFSREIISYLTSLNKWKVVASPIIVYRSSQPYPSQADIMFNLLEQYSYKNSLEIEVYDK